MQAFPALLVLLVADLVSGHGVHEQDPKLEQADYITRHVGTTSLHGLTDSLFLRPYRWRRSITCMVLSLLLLLLLTFVTWYI